MAQKKKIPQIILLDRWEHNFNELTDKEAGQVVKAMYAYWKNKTEPKFKDRTLRFFWSDVQRWLDDSQEHYLEVSKKRADAANNKNKSNNCEQGQQMLTNADNDNDNDNAQGPSYNAQGLIDDDVEETSITDFFTKNKKAKTVLDCYRAKIGNFRSPEEYERLKQIIVKHDETEYILYCIDFMKTKGGKSANYLQSLCDNHYSEYKATVRAGSSGSRSP